MPLTVDEAFRDFVRYEGDGNGGVGALPIGDPQSAEHHPSKKQIRDTVGAVYTIRDEIDGIRDYVEGLVSDVVSQATVPHFSTVTAVQGYSIPVGMNVIYISGRTVSGAAGHYYVRTPGSTHPFRFTDGAGAVWQPSTNPALLSALSTAAGGITVGVGSTGDYPDIPTAIESLRHYEVNGGQRIILSLVSAITRGYLSTQGLHDGKFVITNGMGIARVPLASGFEGVSDVGMGGNNRTDNLLAGFYATMPVLGCIIDMGNTGGSGYYGIQNCHGMVLQGCGVVNAGYNALEWRGAGGVAAYQSVWDGATVSGIRAAHDACIAAQEATANYCCKNSDEGPTVGAVDVSRRSNVHFRAGQAKFSGGAGANVRRVSTLCCEEADMSGAAAYGMIVQHMSSVSGWGMTILNTNQATGELGYGVWVRNGQATLQGATIKDSAGAGDIRIGDSSPELSGASVDVSNVTTTHGLNAIQDYIGGQFNVPSRYGHIWNAAVPAPLEVGLFSATGATRGSDFHPDFGFPRVSSNLTVESTILAAYNPNGQVGRLAATGNTFSLQSTSDQRLKRDLGDIDIDPYEWAMQIRIRNFEWRATGERQIGTFAQELYETDPYAVSPGHGSPGDADFVPWSQDFGKLGPRQHLTIQKLIRHVAALEARLEEIEAR